MMVMRIVLTTAHQTRLQLGHIRSLGHLGVHVLLPLPLPLLAPLLLRLVALLLLEDAAVPSGVLLLGLGEGPLVGAGAGPAHQPGTVVLQGRVSQYGATEGLTQILTPLSKADFCLH